MDQRFGILRIVLAVFHRSMLMKDGFSIALAIKKRLDTTFKTSPMILPGDAPPEIPRVVFKSKDGLILQVAQNISSLQLDIPGEILPNKILYEFQAIGNEVIALVNEDFECGIARIGVVLVGNLILETSGAEFIKDTYFRGFDETLFGNEVHWLTHPVLGEEMINRWVRIKSDSNINGDPNKFVEIMIDSNTMNKDERTMSGDYAKDYLKMCIDDMHDNFDAIIKII